MPKLIPKQRNKVTIYVDRELHEYWQGVLYSPIEDRLKYGFSDICNRLLYEERDRHIEAKRAQLATEQVHG